MRTSKYRTFIGWVIGTVVAMAAIATGVIGQRGPGAPGIPGVPPQGPVRLIETGPEGVFVVTGGMLTKYTPDLQVQGTLKLLDQPRPPVDPENPRPPVPGPGRMLLTEGKLAVLAGDQVICVDAGRLSLIATVRLPDLPPPGPAPVPEDGVRPPLPMGPPPVDMRASGKMVYVTRANEIAAVDVAAGRLVGSASLPKPPLPAPVD